MATDDRKLRGIRGKSLFSMCLRRVATAIDGNENEEGTPQSSTNEESTTALTSLEVMSALESYGPLVLSQTAVARAISKISYACTQNLLCPKSISRLLKLFLDSKCYWEAFRLAASLADSIPPTSFSVPTPQQVAKLRPLLWVGNIILEDEHQHIKIAYMATLLNNQRLPMEWLEAGGFQDIWRLCFDSLKRGRNFDYTKILAATMVEQSSKPSTCQVVSGKSFDASIQSLFDLFLAAMTSIAIFAEDEGSQRRSRSILDCCLNHLQAKRERESNKYMEEELVLLASSFLVESSSAARDTEKARLFRKRLEQQACYGRRDERAIDRLVYLLCYLAMLWSRLRRKAPLHCLGNVFWSFEILGLNVSIDSMLWERAVAILPQVEQSKHMSRFAVHCVDGWGLKPVPRQTQREPGPVLDHSQIWRWEEGIEEWVQTKPAS